MSDSQEKSDDLIAELAKLMASNAQGAEPEAAKPTLRMAPLAEATVAPPSPIRIPGMAPPAAAAPAPAPSAPVTASPTSAAPTSTAPTIRIPGMSPPAAVASEPAPTPEPAPVEPAAPPPRPQFDFGKPPTAAAKIAPEPMTNWQDREVPKAPTPAPRAAEPPVASTDDAEPPRQSSALKPAAELRPDTGFKPTPMSRLEPGTSSAPLVSAPVVAPISVSATATPTNAPAGDGFDFDFGFGAEDAATDSDDKPYDPIADLITAELDAGDVEEAPETEAPKPVTVAPMASMPASVQPMAPTVKTISNPSQAPVLVARPTGNGPAMRPAAAAPMKPAAPASRPAESDRFTVAPVFGLGGKPSAPAPRAEPDPMDEIENLIGEAVRVELSPPMEKTASVSLAPPPPPVVPPLNTQFAPRRSGLKDNEPPMQSAEAAILAAAAATGAEVGRVGAPDNDGRPYKRMKVNPPKAKAMSGGARQYIGMAVAGTLLLAAGFGLYWVLGMGRGDPSTAPVLTAEAGSAKAPAPVAVTPSGTDTGASGVFDQLEGKAAVDAAETLVSRDETAGTDVADVARVVGATPDETEAGLANRKVRTVTVRPDGTIVPGDDAVAGTEALPVSRPNVPALPGDALQPSDLLAEVQTAEVDPIAEAIAGGDASGLDLTPDPNAVTALVATVPSADIVIDPTKVAPVPAQRPTDRSTMVGGSNQVVSLVAPTQPNRPAATPLVAVTNTGSTGGTSGSGPYVQLSSQRTESDAQSSMRSLQSRVNGALEVRRVELAQKGVWYRVVLPARSFQDATEMCASIKSNGGDCLAING